MRKKKYLLSAFLITVSFTAFCISGCGSSNAQSATTTKKDTTTVSEKETEEATGESIIADTDELSNETTDSAEVTTTQTEDNTAKDVASDNSAKTATNRSKSNGDAAKTTTRKNETNAATAAAPAKQANAPAKAETHAHSWTPVYATRTVREAWTETVTEEYTDYEVHNIKNGHCWQEGIAYDLTYQYNDYITNGHWKNETPDELNPDTKSYAFFINHAKWIPDYEEDVSIWVEGTAPAGAAVTFPTREAAVLVLRGSYHTEDVPVTKTRTEIVEHPAETERYVDHYECSCGATK